jgi:hypothetical protein
MIGVRYDFLLAKISSKPNHKMKVNIQCNVLLLVDVDQSKSKVR